MVATHGGPKQRQPDIDRQELWDIFGQETVLDFFFVESKPDAQDKRRGIEKLKQEIAKVAAGLPEVGRSVPKSFQEVQQDLKDIGQPFLPLEQVLAICRDRKMDKETARLFLTISHCLGHLIHYEHDPTLRDIVVLKPDWLATAISFILDDEKTRKAQGLVRISRLSKLWNDASRAEGFRYPVELHSIFLRLMERFDLSYRVADPFAENEADPLSLIAQLVRDTRPEKNRFEVRKLIENKKRSRPEQPCPLCNEWQEIDALLRNAPTTQPQPDTALLNEVRSLKHLLASHDDAVMGRFSHLDADQRRILSKADAAFSNLFQLLSDEAKEGPRLFSLVPVDPGFLDKPKWSSQKFQLILWCEHSRLPLSVLDENEKQGAYDLDFPRDWVISAAPFLRRLTTTLSLVLPVAFTGVKLALDDPAYKAIDEQLRFGKDCFDATLKGSRDVGGWLSEDDSAELPQGAAMRAEGAVLRQLHVLLKEKDPGFGGLVRVMNKRREFLWVHPQFEGEY
ncbi:hypothetical protein GMJAKD_13070 [Candidatus Electrothrix aarhusensis]